MKKTTFGFLFFIFCFGISSVAQVDSAGLNATMKKLDIALLQKDYDVLNNILHTDVNYGHSNGWVQTKTDVFNDFKSGKLEYNKIENNSSAILTLNKKWATVKTNTNAEGTVNGTVFKLTLHVMQVWLKTKKGWQLLARQSAKQ